MPVSTTIIVLLLLCTAIYYVARKRAYSVVGGEVKQLHSLPSYHGMHAALWCGVPAFLLLFVWLAFEPQIITQIVASSLSSSFAEMTALEQKLMLSDIRNLVVGAAISGEVTPELQRAADQYAQLQGISVKLMAVVLLALAAAGSVYALRNLNKDLRARNRVERFVNTLLIVCSSIAIFSTIGIVISVLFESIRFFQSVPITEFIFGTDWSPQIAMRSDQVGSSGAFGAIPLFTGTLLISAIAMVVAVPIGLLSAIYLAEYASPKMRSIVKPLVEVLAGVPTVVYGFFAALTVAPLIRNAGESIGLEVASESALAAGLVMGIMIIPFVSSLSDDVINAVPQSLRDAAYGLGSTKSETIKQVIFPAALPGIVGGVLLAVSRAIGETMIVVMAAGLAAKLTANPLEAVTTVTVQIVTLLVGDQEFDSPKTLAAFALGLTLFLVTLVLNVIALYVVRKYREEYE